ncbi:hypothetical protein ACWDA9_25325, partial [Streptomyces sp. NPDC001193]
KTHSSRGAHRGGGDGGGSSAPRPANPLSGGVAAHSSRPSGGAGGASAPSAAPAPRSGSSTRNTGGDGR